MTNFVYGLSTGISAAKEAMLTQAMTDRFPDCTFNLTDAAEKLPVDWIRPITLEPHPFDANRVILAFPDRDLVNEVVDAFRRTLAELKQWKAS
ncbi:hypothetical protein ACWX0K_24840 (plasmid) [Nitrobacteraceae bacterium UC4446_H13]